MVEETGKQFSTAEKILICDDDDTLRVTIERLLKKKGYEVKAVTRGRAAVEAAKEEDFDLIILDVRMPDMDGIEALKAIRETQSRMKCNVILITGYASEDIPIKAIKLGAADYLKKPFHIDDFLHSVENNVKYIRAMKERDFFFRKMVENSKKLKLNEQELAKLKASLDGES